MALRSLSHRLSPSVTSVNIPAQLPLVNRLTPQVGFALCVFGAGILTANCQAQSTPATDGAPEQVTEGVGRAGDTTETPTIEAPTTETPSGETPPVVAAPAMPIEATDALPPGAPQSVLYYDKLTKEGDLYIAEGSPVRFVGPDFRIFAKRVRLDAEKLTVEADGEVVIERERDIIRRKLTPSTLPKQVYNERITETLRGNNFRYNYATQEGKLDEASVRIAGFNVSTVSLIMNGPRYTAHNVILRPGGLSDEEERIFGKPPLNLRAREVTVNTDQPNARAVVSGAALYYKNTRLFPVPSYVLRNTGSIGSREDQAFRLTPRLSFNSTDGVLITTGLRFPLSSSRPEKYGLTADLGLSTRIGFRGGASLDAETRAGTLSLRGRLSDIVTTQLTNRIELNRAPEVEFTSALFPLFRLPGGRRMGVAVAASAGRYAERTIGRNTTTIRSARSQAIVGLTTRYNDVDGPYAEVFARAANYSDANMSYRNFGVEVGYQGNVSRYIRGRFSFRTTELSGTTPFIFDRIEIAKELRTTFDILPTKRYIIPIDLRYDLDLKRLRDERIGLLRSYGTFAYGVTYQTARRELQLEFRRGF